MHRSARSFLSACLFIILTTGCTNDVVISPVSAQVDAKWSKALRQIASRGGIRIDRLRRHQGTLEAYLGWASVHGQHTNSWGESKEDRRISFLVNVHNAAVLHSLLLNNFPDSPDRVKVGPYQWPGAGFYRGTRYRVDKEWTTLNHLANHDTVSRYAEPLVWIALWDGTQDAPPLQWWSNKKGNLQPQLRRAAHRFINSDRGMSRHGETWQVNPLFIKHQDNFIDWGEAKNLCDWMARHAKGARKTWLTTQIEDCNLTARPPNRAIQVTDIATSRPAHDGSKGAEG